MLIPDTNNIYGKLECSHNLQKLVDLFKYRLALDPDEICLEKSAKNGTQNLVVKAAAFELEIVKAKNPDEYFVNGAVAGNAAMVIGFAKNLYAYLQQAGYPASFEIYDQKFNFLEKIG